MCTSSCRKSPVAAATVAALLLLYLIPLSALAEQNLGEQFRLVGRFVQPSPSTAIFAWPGSTIEIEFTGTSLEVFFQDTGRNSMVVEVDGVTSRLDLSKEKTEYRVVAEATHGKHLVRLIRRTEALFGPTVFTGATTDGVFSSPPKRTRRLFLIGDSISAGYGIEGKTSSCKFSADTENQYLTYGAVAAREFDADAITAAVSGKGLVRNYGGDTKNTMPEIYLRGSPAHPGNLPFPRSDVIVVHLGTNDFANGGRPPDFVERYIAFLAELRENDPDAMIYAAIGPMLAGADLEAATRAAKNAVEARLASKDTKVAFIRFENIAGQAVLGCDWHPSIASHEHMASILSARIEADLKWDRRQ
ncbi:Cellulase/esterase CelE [Ensifer psoraleae]|uniref:SGNH/GDSL hydrolase family protein n=1 Tax=Sinorhizobium psoraleae TaxID=520838 RepID=UPI001569514E|nr:SGNH/GDSL hydrolase family protein [Sinorhizobium psoraleae]NRP69985.1 Cellulase/esterase CelE [Sinorhizobium psoraleae]